MMMMMMGRGVGSGARGALVWTHDGLAGMGGWRAGRYVRDVRFLFTLPWGHSFLFRMDGVDDGRRIVEVYIWESRLKTRP